MCLSVKPQNEIFILGNTSKQYINPFYACSKSCLKLGCPLILKLLKEVSIKICDRLAPLILKRWRLLWWINHITRTDTLNCASSPFSRVVSLPTCIRSSTSSSFTFETDQSESLDSRLMHESSSMHPDSV